MNKKPLISVVMPAYNVEKFIGEAIESILNQTLSDFELIIINDGSADKTLQIIESYGKKDDRIVIITRENKGLIYSRNEGIQRAKGEYIAKMDADDVSLSSRFEKQINLMEENFLDICGASIQGFNESNQNIWQWDCPLTDQDIKFTLMFMSAFAQPVVMMKKTIFDSLKYSDSFPYAEDYKLWTDVAKNNFIMGNVAEVLLKYRVHNKQTTNIHNKEVSKLALQAALEYRNTILSDNVANLFYKYETSSPKELKYMYEALQQKAKKEGVSGTVLAKTGMYILTRNKNISIRLYFVYWTFMRGYIRLNIREIQLFIQAFFCLTRDSKMYLFLKRFVTL
jgi:glycosyltransferase involved in cell wall biosynthesis